MWMFSVGWAKRSVPNNQPLRCWAHFALPNLLALVALFLIVQFAALAHGVEHAVEPAHHDEPVCELCLAFTPLGAGIIGSLPAWQAPMHALVFMAPIPAASPCCFRPTYQSRAPPLRQRSTPH